MYDPSDLDNPLYEYSQIITSQDLVKIGQELTRQYQHTPKYRFILRWGTGIAIGVIIGLLNWLREGKGTIINSGERNEKFN